MILRSHSSKNKSSILDLPDEILHLIVLQIPSELADRVSLNLARVNRRLRRFAWPLFLSVVKVSGIRQLKSTLDFFEASPREYSLYVRSA